MRQAPDTPDVDEERLGHIAAAHHELMRCWLGNLVCVLLIMGPVPVMLPLAIAAYALSLVSVWRLGVAMGERWPGKLACTAVCVIPVFNLLLLFGAAQEASEHLRPFCGQVPFLGFTRARFAIGRGGCPACGYPLTGLRGQVCPECGGPISTSPTPPSQAA